MQPHKHSHIHRERDTNTLIAQYGKKPAPQLREALQNKLQSERAKFKRIEQFKTRSQERGQSR